MTGTCTVCGKPLCRGNRSGLCAEHFKTSPEYAAKRREAIRRSYEENPERRESRRQHMLRIRPLSMTPESIAKRDYATMARERGERIMAWCPSQYRDAYRYMMRSQHLPAAECKRLILDQIRKDRAAEKSKPVSFEEQLQRVADGKAQVVDKLRLPSQDHGFTLGGVVGEWA